jgi:hypothetical protein
MMLTIKIRVDSKPFLVCVLNFWLLFQAESSSLSKWHVIMS